LNQYKTCSKCGQTLSLEMYHKHQTNADRLFSWCKECHRQINAINRQKYRPQLAAQRRAAYRANPELHKARAKAYRDAHPEQVKRLFKEWSLANPAKARERGARRRARAVNNGIFAVTNKEKQRLYKSNCFYCGSRTSIQIDHVIPIARGGRHSIGNLVAACAKCNNHKRARFIMEWRLGMSGPRSILKPVEREK